MLILTGEGIWRTRRMMGMMIFRTLMEIISLMVVRVMMIWLGSMVTLLPLLVQIWMPKSNLLYMLLCAKKNIVMFIVCFYDETYTDNFICFHNETYTDDFICFHNETYW